MEKLQSTVNELEGKLQWKDSINNAVSSADVAWHIAHSLKVIINVVAALKKSDPMHYRWRFNFNRYFVCFLGYIPRGRGKAPNSVLPAEHLTIDMLRAEFVAVRQAILDLKLLDRKHNFEHPYFGQLSASETKKFLFLHTVHHLKIIGDILR